MSVELEGYPGHVVSLLRRMEKSTSSSTVSSLSLDGNSSKSLLYRKSSRTGSSLILVDSPLGVLQVSEQNQKMLDKALQQWPAIHLGNDYSVERLNRPIYDRAAHPVGRGGGG